MIGVHPTDHDAKLLDWSYALDFNKHPVKNTQSPDPTVLSTAAPAAPRSIWERLQDENPFEDEDAKSSIVAEPPVDPNKLYVWAVVAHCAGFYPPEVFAKRTPSPALDIYMAAKCVVALLGGNVETGAIPDSVPIQIRTFLSASLLESPTKRPKDAWQVHDDFDQLVGRILPKKYREFKMPPTNVGSP